MPLLLSVDLRGRVVDAPAKEPLSAVRVASPSGTVSTDAAGNFVLTGTTLGELSLRISLPSYALLKKTVEVGPAAPRWRSFSSLTRVASERLPT